MAPPEHYIPVAREAEKLGYHAIVLPDSIFYSEEVSKPYPYTQDGSRMWDGETPWIEPIVGAAAMAAATEKIFFYTNSKKPFVFLQIGKDQLPAFFLKRNNFTTV